MLAAVVLSATVAPATAGAQAPTSAATARAREAFQEGVKLEETGHYEQALLRFREVVAVKKTPQVLAHIAFCLEKTGLPSEALATYREASQMATATDAATVQVKRTIDESLASLDQRTPSLTLQRGKGADKASVMLDGKAIESLDQPFRLPPGKHLVQARARNKDNFRSEVNLAEGQRTTLVIALDDLDEAPASTSKPKNTAEPPPVEPPKPASKRSVGPFVVLGVGAASLVAGGVFFGLRGSKKSELESKCNGLTCPSSARDTGDTLRMYNTLSSVGVSVGAAGLAAGVIWLIASSPDSEPTPRSTAGLRWRFSPDASPAPLGAGVAGSW